MEEIDFDKNIFCVLKLVSFPVDSDVNIFAWLPKQPGNSVKFQRTFHVSTLKIILKNALQPLKENSEDCNEGFIKATILHRFHVQIFQPFLSQLKGQADSDSLLINLMLHLVNQNHLLNVPNDQRNGNDAQQLGEKSINVFT